MALKLPYLSPIALLTPEAIPCSFSSNSPSFSTFSYHESLAGLWSLREELHSSCKGRCSAQVSFQCASLGLSLLHFNSNAHKETAQCAIPCRKKEKIFPEFLQSTTFFCIPSMVYLLLHRTDTILKRNSQFLCRNPSCYSDSIPHFWCSFCRSYFTAQTLLFSVWQLLSLLQIFSYIFTSFIA